jgi:hypothetical protein
MRRDDQAIVKEPMAKMLTWEEYKKWKSTKPKGMWEVNESAKTNTKCRCTENDKFCHLTIK